MALVSIKDADSLAGDNSWIRFPNFPDNSTNNVEWPDDSDWQVYYGLGWDQLSADYSGYLFDGDGLDGYVEAWEYDHGFFQDDYRTTNFQGDRIDVALHYTLISDYDGDDDDLTGSPIVDVDSDDEFDGHSDHEVVFLGPGKDTLDGSGGDDTLVGGDDDDSIVGGSGDDRLYGDYANVPKYVYKELDEGIVTDPDEAKTYPDYDVLTSDDDPTRYDYVLPDDEDTSLSGDDTLEGGDDDDSLVGGRGDDLLNGGDDSDTLEGGDGTDILAVSMSEDDADSLTGGAGGDVFVLSYEPPQVVPGDSGLSVTADDAVNLGRYGLKLVFATAAAGGIIGGPVGTALGAAVDLGASIADVLLNSGTTDDDTIPSAQADNYNYVNVTDFNPREDYIILPLPTVQNNLAFDVVQSSAGWSIQIDDGDQRIANLSIDNDFLREDIDDPTSALLGGDNAAGVLEAYIENALIVAPDGSDVSYSQRRDGTYSDPDGDGSYTQSDAGDQVSLDTGDSSEVSDLANEFGDSAVIIFGNWGGQVLTGDGNTYVRGTDDNDALIGYTYTGFVDGLENGFDPYALTDGANVIEGLGGDDGLYGGAGADSLDGGDGDDYLAAGSGDDTLYGGDDTDTFYIDHVNIPQSVSDGSFQENIVSDLELFETIVFDATYTDTTGRSVTLTPDDIEFGLSGTNSNILIRFISESFPEIGGDGVVIGKLNQVNVTNTDATLTDLLIDLDSAASSDVFSGNKYDAPGLTVAYNDDETQIYVTRNVGTGTSGDDEIVLSTALVDIGYNYQGLAGDDTITTGTGRDTVDGGSGDDSIVASVGGDTLDGGDDDDTLDFSSLDVSAGAVALATDINGSGQGLAKWGGGDEAAILLNFEHIIGSDGNDTITGGDSGESFDGGQGDDSINASAGSDTLFASPGADTMDGGAGTDTLDFSSSLLSGGANVDGAAATATVKDTGGSSSTFSFSNVEVYQGSDDADTIAGGDGDDTIDGGDGNDSLSGGAGTDVMSGGAGNDTFVASLGVNLADGEEGVDVLDMSVSGLAANGAFIGRATSSGGPNGPVLAKFGGSDGSNVLIQLENIEHVIGTDLADTFNSDGYDLLGVVRFDGEGGNDTIVGSGDAETLNGGDGDDSISGGGGADSIDGGGDADTISGGNGADTIDGGDGADSIEGLSGSDNIDGGDGDDSITWSFGEGDDTIRGGDDTDTLTINADNGDSNRFTGRVNIGITVLVPSQAKMDIEIEDDAELDVAYVEEIVINADPNGGDVYTLGSLSAAGVSLSTVHFNGGDGEDLFDGSGMTDDVRVVLDGGDGDDTLIGGRGDDIIRGGGGNDVKHGGEGIDTFIGTADHFIDQGFIGDFADAEKLIIEGYAHGVEFGDSGHGYTTLMLDPDGDGTPDASVHVEGHFSADELHRFDLARVGDDLHITLMPEVAASRITDGGGGTSGDDRIYGSDEDDTLSGGSGEDTLDGNGGDDDISGGSDDDHLRGEDGNDTLRAGSGNDFADGGHGNDLILGGTGTDTLEGEGGDDTIEGGLGDDLIDGGFHNDLLLGQDGDDTLLGDNGDDTAFGGAGDDELLGGLGDDSLIGGAGDDLIDGGPGDDTLSGDGVEIAFVGADAAYRSILGYADTAAGEAVVVLANTAAGEAAGYVADLAVPEDAVWFLVPNGHHYNPGAKAGGGYTLTGDAANGYVIEDAGGTALRGVFDGRIGAGAYFSDAALNADGREHVHTTADGTMAWEDLWKQGDGDFNDVIVRVAAAEPGNDTFVLAPGEGTDTIEDFVPGEDLIGLADGLTVADLSFSGSDILFGEEVLATLTDVDATALTASDFVLV